MIVVDYCSKVEHQRTLSVEWSPKMGVAWAGNIKRVVENVGIFCELEGLRSDRQVKPNMQTKEAPGTVRN